MNGEHKGLAGRGIGQLTVKPDASLLEVLRCHRGVKDQGIPAGIALVVDGDGKLIGTITDGDMRRGSCGAARSRAPPARS